MMFIIILVIIIIILNMKMGTLNKGERGDMGKKEPAKRERKRKTNERRDKESIIGKIKEADEGRG